MAFDLAILGSKLERYRKQFQASHAEVSDATGIPLSKLTAYEAGTQEPTGDHILILADFFQCDYKFFLSNEKLAPFEQTDTLFRKFGDELSKDDRWAIQEFLFLCECEEDLLKVMPVINRTTFHFQKTGDFKKKHGIDAARALRTHLNLSFNSALPDVYRAFRSIGIHVFRRSLGNSDISGLFIRHPTAGPCVLVNYSEDVYRQRFTAAHEAGHSILDDDDDPPVMTKKWSGTDLSEIRAHTFASHLLIPPDLLNRLGYVTWNAGTIVHWAAQLNVSTAALANALKDQKIIDLTKAKELKAVKVPSDQKVDPELPNSLSEASRNRKEQLLKRGLSTFYVGLCFDAYEQDVISAGRLAEMLLVDGDELRVVAALYGRSLAHGH